MKKAVALYRNTLHQGSSSKTLDARLLSQLCYRLEQAQHDEFALIQVLGDLRQCWLTYQVLLQDAAHPYPAPLRAELLQLAKQLLDELQKDSADTDVAWLVSVNRALLQGLEA